MTPLTDRELAELKKNYGTSDIRKIIKANDASNVLKLITPVIAHNFNISKRKLLASGEHEIKNSKKLLVFCMIHYFDIPPANVAEYFSISKRTVWRYLGFINRIIFADSDSIEYRAYRDFIEKSKKTVKYIQENYLKNGTI